MKLDLFQHELKMLDQALGYAIMYAKTEEERAEFVMLKVKVSTMNCPFQYCSQNPKCEGTCYLNK